MAGQAARQQGAELVGLVLLQVLPDHGKVPGQHASVRCSRFGCSDEASLQKSNCRKTPSGIGAKKSIEISNSIE